MNEEADMLKQVVIGIGLLGLAVVAIAQPSGGKTDVDEVRLAVFRQQLAFWLDEHSRGSKTVVCLAIEHGGVRRSVTKEYLKRFQGEPAVRTGDDCDERASGAVERGTGRPAVLVAAGDLAWKSPDEAWVTTRHYRSAVVSGVRTQRVVREETGWVCLGQIIKDMPL
jgi:threonine dehydrogenase-like Zn-dependent dehydrogenase